MAKRVASHIRSHLVLFIALFVALTIGTAWDATAPKNSVTSKSIKYGQVKTKDLAKKAVTGNRVKPNTLTGTQIKESSLSASVLQRRVSGTCTAGQTIAAVKSDGSVSCLSNGGPPTGPAAGGLTGTYPDPAIAGGAVTSAKLADAAVTTARLDNGSVDASKLADGAVTDAKVAAANKNGVASTPSMRTLGSGAQQAMPGNATPGGPPSGTAGGTLKGTYPNPDPQRLGAAPAPTGRR